MAKALVVDDSPVDRTLASRLLEQAGFGVVFATNGAEGLARLEAEAPDLVVTDMQMPEMNGLQLVEAVRSRGMKVPVILMTAHGSEDIAAEALRKGAASYVPKRHLARDLADTAQRLIGLAAQVDAEDALRFLAESEAHFVLDNDLSRIRAVISYLREEVERLAACDDAEMMQVGVALDEAISNAILHGNLEVDSAVRDEEGGMEAFFAVARERMEDPAFRDRRVHVIGKVSRERAAFVVRDDGDGFDPADLPDPTDPANLEKASGRGLLLIRSFMDAVHFNEKGNEVTMVKRFGG